LDQAARPVAIAEPPTRHGVRLAEAVQHKDIVVELRRAAERLIVTEDAIDLIADEQYAPVGGQTCQLLQRPAFVDHAGRVGRAVDCAGLVARRWGRPDPGRAGGKWGRGTDEPGWAAGDGDKRGVHHETGVEADPPVAGFARSPPRRPNPAAGAAGDEGLALRL